MIKNDFAVELNISYSVEQEIWRVQSTLKKLSWYLEQGYHIDLPEGVTGESSEEEITRAVKGEYTEADYAACAEMVLAEWPAISSGFEKMRSESSFHLRNEYNVILTKYGVGGSYNPDLNQVIVKVSIKPQSGTTSTIAHEIVHMTIQYLIDQYHVRHWRKERLVDLLLEHYFPGLKKMQQIKEDISMVDQAFEKSFSDMEAIAHAIGG